MMKLISYRYIAVGIAMLLAAGLSVAMAPTKRVADNGSAIDLETIIPKQFGEWQLDPTVAPLLAVPDVQSELYKIYSQTLARTYINNRGERVMLSIAYGGNQNREMQVHRPEVCYPAQGFQLLSKEKGTVHTNFGELPVMRLVAQLGARNEPITYWVRIGDSIVRGNIEQGLARLKHGLAGQVPDGLLFRVSTINADESAAFRAQETFIRDMLVALPPASRARLAGSGQS